MRGWPRSKAERRGAPAYASALTRRRPFPDQGFLPGWRWLLPAAVLVTMEALPPVAPDRRRYPDETRPQASRSFDHAQPRAHSRVTGVRPRDRHDSVGGFRDLCPQVGGIDHPGRLLGPRELAAGRARRG